MCLFHSSHLTRVSPLPLFLYPWGPPISFSQRFPSLVTYLTVLWNISLSLWFWIILGITLVLLWQFL